MKHTQKNLTTCDSKFHGANDQYSSIPRVTLSSHPKSRKNSISSCQTEPNPVTTNQWGASNQRLQNIVVDQENVDLKNEIAELRNQISISSKRIEKLESFCSCLIPYLGDNWNDFTNFVNKHSSNNEVKNPNNLMLRHNQLEQEVLMLKNRMENRVDVNKTASGCDYPSASQRFVHTQTPMNLNKGLPLHNQGRPKTIGMDVEFDADPYPL